MTPDTTNKSINILVAEDNPINQKLIQLIFKSLGYEIDIAINGTVAVEMIQNKEFDLVFMDIQMPEKDGIAATSEIRSLGYQMPIIAMTANNDVDTQEKAENCGMNDFLAKPIKPESINCIIQKWS